MSSNKKLGHSDGILQPFLAMAIFICLLIINLMASGGALASTKKANDDIVWPPKALSGAFSLGNSENHSTVCLFYEDGYIRHFYFSRPDTKVVISDGTYQFGNQIDATQCEIKINNIPDVPSGKGIFKFLPKEADGRVVGFTFQLGDKVTKFGKGPDVELQYLFNSVFDVDDKRNIRANDEWSVLPNIIDKVSNTPMTVETVKANLVGVWMMPKGSSNHDVLSFDSKGRITFSGFTMGGNTFGGKNKYSQGKVTYRLVQEGGKKPKVVVMVSEGGAESSTYIIEGMSNDILLMRAFHYKTKKPFILRVWGRGNDKPYPLDAEASQATK